MNGLLPNPILEFNPNQMKEVRQVFGYEDPNRLQQDIKLLQHWIQKQEHFLVKDYDEAYLERHLICSKGSIERAKKRLDKLCTLRGLMPEYLQGFDIKNEFHTMLNIFNVCVMPKPTPDNYRVILFNAHYPDAALFESMDLARYLTLIMAYVCSYDYNAGIEIIFDSKNITLGIMSKISPIHISNTLMLITEGLGLLVKGLHVISGSKVMEFILTIIKQGVSKKLTSRLHVHDSYEPMYKYIPKEILPKDIGGDLPNTIKELTENNFKELSSPEFVQITKHMESAATDESKRLSSKFNEDYSGMPGSFKVLSVD